MSAFHLQAIGGWKSPVMLQRYGKVRNKALHEQMAKLDDANPTTSLPPVLSQENMLGKSESGGTP